MASKGPGNGAFKRPSFQKPQTMTQTPKPAASSTTSSTSAAVASCKPTHDQVAQRAKSIWQAKGCPPGQDQQNWLEAEKQLHAEKGCH
jgi:hypothetical protein